MYLTLISFKFCEETGITVKFLMDVHKIHNSKFCGLNAGLSIGEASDIWNIGLLNCSCRMIKKDMIEWILIWITIFRSWDVLDSWNVNISK